MKKSVITLVAISMVSANSWAYEVAQHEPIVQVSADEIHEFPADQDDVDNGKAFLARYFEGGQVFADSQMMHHQQTNIGVRLYSHTQYLADGWLGRSSVTAGVHHESHNNGPLVAATQSVLNVDHEASISAGLTGEHLGAGAQTLHDLVETDEIVIAAGAIASAGLHGVNFGPQIEIGGSRHTITVSFFDVKIGEREQNSANSQEWTRKRYSLNPIVLVVNMLIGQKSALDVLGIPAKEINPIGRLIAYLKSDDKPVEVVNPIRSEAPLMAPITGDLNDGASIRTITIEAPGAPTK